MNEQEYIKRVDDLSYDIVMSLKTGLPINTINEYELTTLLDGQNLKVLNTCPHLYELMEYFLDNGIPDNAWNIGNMLIGEERLGE